MGGTDRIQRREGGRKRPEDLSSFLLASRGISCSLDYLGGNWKPVKGGKQRDWEASSVYFFLKDHYDCSVEMC